MASEDEWLELRERMVAAVANEVRPRDRRVLEAFRRIPRHLFVPESERRWAYEDHALPIGDGQTISQPSMIAIMLDALECDADSRVLEIGAGSGYAAALLSCLARRVDAIEIRPALAERAIRTLATLGIDNVRIHVRDGNLGLPEAAPFDRILVSAAPERVPEALIRDLAPGGRIAIPVGSRHDQVLWVGERDDQGRVRYVKDVPCVFVPLVSA
ncbi:MAG: protein-L-isoaspartate(D-aspartate) O-methyltransferase [Polyangiaceae bacterium]